MPQTSGFPQPTYQLQSPLDISKIVSDETWTNLTNIAQENQWYLQFPMKKLFQGFEGINDIFFNIQDFTIPGFSSQNVDKMYRGMPIPVPGGVRKEGNDNIVEIEYLIDANFTQYKLMRLWFYLNEYALRGETINTASLDTFYASSVKAWCGMVPAVDITLYYIDSKKRIAMITQFLNCFPDTFHGLDVKSQDPDNLKHKVGLKFFMHRDLM